VGVVTSKHSEGACEGRAAVWMMSVPRLWLAGREAGAEKAPKACIGGREGNGCPPSLQLTPARINNQRAEICMNEKRVAAEL